MALPMGKLEVHQARPDSYHALAAAATVVSGNASGNVSASADAKAPGGPKGSVRDVKRQSAINFAHPPIRTIVGDREGDSPAVLPSVRRTALEAERTQPVQRRTRSPFPWVSQSQLSVGSEQTGSGTLSSLGADGSLSVSEVRTSCSSTVADGDADADAEAESVDNRNRSGALKGESLAVPEGKGGARRNTPVFSLGSSIHEAEKRDGDVPTLPVTVDDTAHTGYASGVSTADLPQIIQTQASTRTTRAGPARVLFSSPSSSSQDLPSAMGVPHVLRPQRMKARLVDVPARPAQLDPSAQVARPAQADRQARQARPVSLVGEVEYGRKWRDSGVELGKVKVGSIAVRRGQQYRLSAIETGRGGAGAVRQKGKSARRESVYVPFQGAGKRVGTVSEKKTTNEKTGEKKTDEKRSEKKRAAGGLKVKVEAGNSRGTSVGSRREKKGTATATATSFVNPPPRASSKNATTITSTASKPLPVPSKLVSNGKNSNTKKTHRKTDTATFETSHNTSHSKTHDKTSDKIPINTPDNTAGSRQTRSQPQPRPQPRPCKASTRNRTPRSQTSSQYSLADRHRFNASLKIDAHAYVELLGKLDRGFALSDDGSDGIGSKASTSEGMSNAERVRLYLAGEDVALVEMEGDLGGGRAGHDGSGASDCGEADGCDDSGDCGGGDEDDDDEAVQVRLAALRDTTGSYCAMLRAGQVARRKRRA